MADLGDKYQKYEQREHIYLLPDTYIGSIETDTVDTYILNDNKLIKSSLQICPGLFKIFGEIVDNAMDHSNRKLKDPVTKIMTNIDMDTGRITIINNGDGIDVEKHPKHNIWIPEMLFSNLLTSSNFRQDEIRHVAGRNGLGSSLTNIFSKEFIIETVDTTRKKKYQQRFYNNMIDKDEPIITKYSKKPYTSVEFLPDYERFGMTKLTDDMFKMFERRIIDLAGCTNSKVEVYFNDKKIEYKSFERYIDLYLGPKTEYPRVYEQVNDRWEVCATYSEDGYHQVSFVNGNYCKRGGTFTNYITDQITKKLAAMIKSKKKKTVKTNHIKEYLQVFIKATINNPSFDTQTKEYLTNKVSDFGSKCELSDKFIDKVYKCGIIERAVKLSDFQDEKKLSKLDSKKKTRITGIPNLEDANKAGTKESDKCTLILTEGLSAKTMVMSGFTEIGRDYYGCFPLKGKLLNVKDAAIKKIAENDEIANIMKILGLEIGKKYTDLNSLRYGRVLILSDQDVDGTHIASLVMNVFSSMWDSLPKMDNFLVRMQTPIIKASKGSHTLEFYNIQDYNRWQSENSTQGWTIKYYKGLGTSTSKEAKEYFKNMNVINFKWTDHSDQAIDLAFNKKRADDRKQWLMAYESDVMVDYAKLNNICPYEEFIHKELIHFSNADLVRSIPCIIDGFKESTRKIMFACLKRKLYSEMKVAQLSGYVAEKSAYHHGEVSLQQAIVCMAQNYVGSNNLSLLLPLGQFGSRNVNGKDAASARYIFTMLNPITKILFNETDNELLNYLEDDGQPIEPKWYIPILPMVLVNGALGIGTGFSTTIPSYNPRDIVKIMFDIISGIKSDNLFLINAYIDSIEECKEPVPWYLGFKGKIEQNGKNYISKGIYNFIDDNTVTITELPIGISSSDYTQFLEKVLTEGKYLKDFKSDCTDYIVSFTLNFIPGKLAEIRGNFENAFNLTNTRGLSLTNMHLYNSKGRITKYETIMDIIKEFCKVRIEYYFKRKDHLIATIKKDLLLLSTKCRFIHDVISGTIKVMNQRTDHIKSKLLELEYPEQLWDSLINMPIRQLTLERKEELELATRNCEQELERVKSIPVQKMWISELELFIEQYNKYEEQVLADYQSTSNRVTDNKKASRTKRTTKK